MPTFTYTGIFDHVDIPLLSITDLAYGAEFDVPTELVDQFTEQPDNFTPTSSKSTTKATTSEG
jgi:hypothetical protein